MQQLNLTSTYKLLDRLLRDFVQLAESQFRSTASFVLKYQGEIDQTTLIGILEKLSSDGFLHFTPDEERFEQGFYRLTFAGRLFHAEGGYVGNYRHDNRSRRSMQIFNIAVGIGGGVATVYYGLEIINHIIRKIPPF